MGDMEKRKLKREEVRIAIAGDLVHSKNQMTPELVSFVIKMINDCTKICKTVIILGNHDFLANNLDRMDALSPLIESLDNEDILFYLKFYFLDSHGFLLPFSLFHHDFLVFLKASFQENHSHTFL